MKLSFALIQVFALSVVADKALHTLHADDVLAALERDTRKQEDNIKTTTEKLRALQERVQAIFPHKND